MPLGRSGPMNCSPSGRKGKNFSVKYTSDELTTRPMLETHTRYDPGDKVLRPKLTPTHAWASMVVFTTALACFTVCARHPTGMMHATMLMKISFIMQECFPEPYIRVPHGFRLKGMISKSFSL